MLPGTELDAETEGAGIEDFTQAPFEHEEPVAHDRVMFLPFPESQYLSKTEPLSAHWSLNVCA